MDKHFFRKEGRLLTNIFLVLVVVAIVGLVFYFLNNGTQTNSSVDISGEKDRILDCFSSGDDKSFFAGYGEIDPKYNIKISFSGDSVNEISFIYTASFSSEQNARDASSLMHGRYNIYMRDTGIYQEALTPNFYTTGTKTTANLFITRDKLNVGTASIVFIDSETFLDIGSFSLEDFASLYRNKSFNCEIK